MGFSRPVEEEDTDAENAPPGLPPEFQPLLDRMEEQENRYECVLCDHSCPQSPFVSLSRRGLRTSESPAG